MSKHHSLSDDIDCLLYCDIFYELFMQSTPGIGKMVIAILSKRKNFLETTGRLSVMNSEIEVIPLRNASDLIRQITTRAAIDVVIVDAERQFGCVETIVAWRSCYARSDFAVLLAGQLMRCTDMELAFKMGVDDIFVGAHRLDELYSRVMRCVAAVKRQRADLRVLTVGGVVLDQGRQCLVAQQVLVELTAREFALAWLFFTWPGVLLDRQRIIATIWGNRGEEAGRALEQAIHRLRRKLGMLPACTTQIKAVYSQGYRLVLPVLSDDQSSQHQHERTTNPTMRAPRRTTEAGHANRARRTSSRKPALASQLSKRFFRFPS
jgi:DNA-binding response OmpR family regulator